MVSAQRELKEELGIEAKIRFVTIEKLNYTAWIPGAPNLFELFIYCTTHNGPFTPDPVELDKIEFFSFHKITDMINSGQKFHPEFLLCWDIGIFHPCLAV